MCFCLDGDETQKEGQIAHVDRDRNNNDPANLVFLCLPHHDQYDTARSQTKRYQRAEILDYRSRLYERLGTFDARLVITIETDDHSVENVYRIIRKLESTTDCTIKIEGTFKGSLILAVRLHKEGAAILERAQAERSLSDVIGSNVLSIEGPSRSLASSLVRLCEDKLEEGDVVAAEAIINKALQRDPFWATAWRALSSTLVARARLLQDRHERRLMLEEAEAAALKAVEFGGSEAASWVAYGVVVADQGENADALACLLRALEMNPESSDAWYNKGILEQRMDEYKAAYDSLAEAVRLGDPDAASVLDAVQKKLRRKHR